MTPKTRAVLKIRPRPLATRATSDKLTITLIADAMMAPLAATCDDRVPAAARLPDRPGAVYGRAAQDHG